ncbi:DNA damage repair protein [Apiospora arundinis]
MNAGFHDLFEEKSSTVPETSARMLASCLSLTSEAASAGFTALITDNCSRKAKYMQALALGLPCLSWNWITACHAKGSVVDWLPYMLCAGPSTVLDGAFKSRDLPKYEASDARLSLTISQRPKLLDEMSVLLVVKKTPKHEKKCTLYAFLVHVLGANLERVTTPSEAGHILREREAAGRPFDWVYPDGDNAVFNVLTGGPPTQANNTKKRKRQSTTNSGSFGTPLQSMPRILTDELIVQSLILGRLVEEGDVIALAFDMASDGYPIHVLRALEVNRWDPGVELHNCQIQINGILDIKATEERFLADALTLRNNMWKLSHEEQLLNITSIGSLSVTHTQLLVAVKEQSKTMGYIEAALVAKDFQDVLRKVEGGGQPW